MFASQHRSRRSLNLLASGSLAALWLALGAVSAQAETCSGDYCAGEYSDITYESVDFLFLTAGHDLTVTTGGIYVSSQSGAYTGLYSDFYGPQGDGIDITNGTGAGIEFDNPFGTIDIGLTRDKPDNGVLSITGTTAGVRLNGSGYFWTSLGTEDSIPNGTITATNGAGIDATFNGSMDMRLASTITGTTGAIVTNGLGSLSLVNNPSGELLGGLVLHNSGGVAITNLGLWSAAGASVFGDDGFGSLLNQGVIAASAGGESAATLSISGLNFWENRGLVLFGANEGRSFSDGVANDRIALANPITFAAGTGSMMVMDVAFSGEGQANCSAAVDADCLYLGASTVTGSTSILVNGGDGPGSLARIALVDVSGGTTAASNFTLSADSSNYTAEGGGLVRAGLFDYSLAHDDGADIFYLDPHPNGTLRGVVMTGAMADSVWTATTGHWQTRQADLRDAASRLGGGAHPGFWLKLVNNDIDRRLSLTGAVGGEAIGYDVGYRQKTTGVVGGVDLLNVADGNQSWVVGVTAGRVTSDADFKIGSAGPEFEGATYGAYVSLLGGPWFLDGIVNVNDLDLTYDLGFDLASRATAKTVGAQAEGGYRIPVNEGSAWIEPIATLAYLTRDIGSLELTDALSADVNDDSSFKGALGLRLGGKMNFAAATVGLAATGRVWEQFSGGGSELLLSGVGDDLIVADEELGTLGDVSLEVNLTSSNGRLSGFADYGFKFADGYSDSTASIGVRFNF